MDKILHYNLDKKLGDGKYGEYYLAWDSGLDRVVMIEFLSPALALNDVFRNRFAADMQKLAEIDHDHIARFYALEEAEGKLFIIREYIEGRSLKDIIAGETFSYALFLNYAIQIVTGLKAAHEVMVVHRSICSQNIVIDEKKKIKLVNFGLPGKLDNIGGEQPPSAYDFYLSPEQTENMLEDQYSDLFSLGVVFYEMLTGKRPFEGQSRKALFNAIRTEEPDFTVMSPAGQVPPDGRLLIEKLLSKNVRDRFRDDEELLVTLKAMLAYHFKRVDNCEKQPKHQSPRTYALISVLVVLLIIFWLVVSTVYR